MESMNALLAPDSRRSNQRVRLLRELAEHWHIAPDAITLGSIVRRLGPAGVRLSELRMELRDGVAHVLGRNRRLSSLIGMHRRINRDVMNLVLTGQEDGEVSDSGFLINARA